ncbi:MAG TPA: PKD domain-containing protein [Chitinophagales bacterium]|nr:PKD domain-containing protein [Chitinophagales bacterium]
MRNFYSFSGVIGLCLLASPWIAPLKAQQISGQQITPTNGQVTHSIIHIDPPKEINFQQLADYERTHPPATTVHFVEQGEDREQGFHFTPQNIPAGAPVTDYSTIQPQGQGTRADHLVMSPAPTATFNGTLGDGTLIPPDIQGATGPTYVMETNNLKFDIYTKTGTHQTSLSITSFFNATGGNGYFDPHILYDNVYGRFIVCIDGNVSNGHGGLFVAVSKTSDPTGAWWLYSIDDGDGNSSHLLDYPEMGYNNKWVVLTANMFASSVISYIYVCDRASMYSGTLGTVHNFTDANAFTWVPAQTYDTSQALEYMVQDANGSSGGNGYMQVGYISGTVASPTYNAGSNIGINQPWNETSTGAGQKGSNNTLEAGDTRVMNGVPYINGKLWFTHSVFLPSSGTPTHIGVDWWSINPSTLTVSQFGRIADNNSNTNYYYPSISVNSAGDALLGYCVSGTDSFYSSAAYSFRAGTDAISTMQSRYIYKNGTAGYYQTLGGGRNRWGDYTGAAVDPTDNSFWGFGGWAYTSTLWGTEIVHVGAAAPITVPPVANFSVSDTLTTCTGTIQFTDLSTNVPTSWLWNFGDGATSAAQNPSHTYTTNGYYTVSLTATNAYGSNTATHTNYIHVNKPAGPTAANVTHCGASTFSLSASTSYGVSWFDSTGTRLSGSNPFVTPSLTHTTTYWVEDTVTAGTSNVGLAANTSVSAGGYFSNSTDQHLIFDALSDMTIVSVVAYAQSAGSRTISLRNSGGTVITSTSVNMVAGQNTVTLNFSVPAGTNYGLCIEGTANLYRNNPGTTSCGYPFTVPGVVSITSSTAGDDYYYYFYNWVVKGPNCVSSRTAVSAIVGGSSIAVTPTINAVACYGGSTGSVNLSVSGGTPSYTYSWSNGQTSSTLSNVTAGTYTVTVGDAGGCSTTASETVNQPSAALSASATPTSASCNGQSNGGITLSVSGGTTGYTYNWGGGVTTQNRTNIAAGTYTVTVTDAHSCSTTATATVTQPSALGITITPANASCGSSANGSASASVTGGTTGYTYHWSNNATTSTISNLGAGNYTLTVTDSHSCTATASTTISNSGSLTLNATVTNVNCNGNSTGRVTTSLSGGTNPVQYIWSNGATTSSLNNVPANTYTVTVSDGAGCSATSSQTVTEPAALAVSLTPVNAGCGSPTGSVSASVSGGTTSYTYHWSNNATSTTITGLTAGNYSVTITDNHSCTVSASASVSSSASLVSTPAAVSPLCPGLSNGSASVTITSGTSPYTYIWSNGSTTASIANISAGTYYVTISDAGSCHGIDTVVVTQPDIITLFINASSPTCGGNADGSASISVTGGTPAFSYNWSTGATGSAISNLNPGGYSVTATDAHNCSASSTFNITTPAPITATTVTTADSCYGDLNGTVQLAPSGGTAPYTYLWSNGYTSGSLSNLGAATYTVTITDSHSCSGTVSVNITQPNPIVIYTSSTNATNGQNNGTASVDSIRGGLPSYNVLWSDGQTTPTAVNLAGGTYTVTVTDKNGCQQTETVVVTNITGINVVSEDGLTFKLYPNPAKGSMMVSVSELKAPTTITMEDIVGQTIFTHRVTDLETTIDLTQFAAGVYVIVLHQGDKEAEKKFVLSR